MKVGDRLRAALLGAPREKLFAGDDPRTPKSACVPAAVLIAVTDRPRPGVLFIVRRDTLRTHAGQVAFPGGRIDEGESAADAAIREAWEELALEPGLVEPIAALDPYLTVTNYRVTPVLAAIPADLPLVPHEHEVADWFEAPLDHLLDPAQQHRRTVLFQGRPRHYYEIPWQGQRIWGATAAMLVNLSRRIDWPID